MPLTPEATAHLDAFTRRMMGCRQASDDERFYAFVISCHRTRMDASVAEIREFLSTSIIGNRFEADELLDWYCRIYETGRGLLAQYDGPPVLRRG